ncbi:SMP-30/gluconolactonase/LRE family protein [Pricia sp. S334]|uniref:SMP-30/gluconolactonase/LRE family protein n=1 Tax=Pricia mediterranea TaxID=3076079 RepID=A0ABU3L3V8_9FLAO|nr:SMP-30/gluconolactonase/LRE family protein [Pricia sp. S334]MDT7828424.1 SMP-30/gluconolactonase/LRE family protein [Pricia sp. S334]
MKKKKPSKGLITCVLSIIMMASLSVEPILAQETQNQEPYPVGKPLGLTTSDGDFEPITSNVKVYGGIQSAESCSYDAATGLIVVPNRGLPPNMQTNDAWVSLINPDGSVNSLRWIGVQRPDDRKELTPPLILNEPFGSDIINGMLYVADRDGGTGQDDPSVAVIRKFSMQSGKPVGEVKIEGAGWINDIEVKEDGTIYATETGDFFGENPNPDTWKVWKVTPTGKATVLVQGKPLNAPNGIAFDPEGNIVVANFGNVDVLTFSEEGKLLKTESAAQPGSDGLVVMPDGTKYVCSVRHGGVSRIHPGESAELIAENVPSAASMCYDAKTNQLVIPMNANNSLAFIPLD